MPFRSRWVAPLIRSAALLSFLLPALPAAGQAPTSRHVPAKPTPAEMASPATANRLVVKFREGSNVRIRAGRATAAEGARLDQFGSALASAGVALSNLRRLHARPEQELDAQRDAAQRASGRQLADLNLYYVIDLPAGVNAVEVAERLNALPIVERAEPELRPAPLPTDLSPPTPGLSGSQTYQGAPPEGVGALDPTAIPGGDGTGMRVVDIEYSWVLDHEDLELPASANIDSATAVDPFPADQGDHGTAVLGEIGGKRNNYGVTGITPGAQLLVAPANTAQFRYDVARAIGIATGALRSGDVILIEQQAPACGGACADSTQVGCGPVEERQANFDAIATATALGIIVVEAAGNGQVNLDLPSCGGRFSRSVRDSGAIIVGAGSPTNRSRLGFSTYGDRVDVQGWGTAITTTGYGDAFDPGDVRQRYTNNFGGTSGASPIVTGAVLAIQGALKARGFALATPAEMREALVVTGTPQTGGEHIGPLPDIRAALDRLLDSRGGGAAGWKPWRSLGGSLASFPECSSNGVGRIDCWAQGAGGTLAWNWSANGDTWAGWTNLGGSVASTPECVARSGRTDCFVTTPAKRMAQITYNGSNWGGWGDLGGAVTGRPSCVAGTGLKLDCFAVGSDKTLHRRQFDGAAWKAWQKLGGNAINRPECVARSGGIDCLVVDGSKNLHTRRLNGSTWAAWKKIGSGFGIAPHCLVSGSKIDCFAQSSSQGLLKGYFNGTSWTTWNTVAGSSGVNTQPYCNRSGSSDFDCYWTTSGFDLVRRQRSASTWLAGENLDGAVQQRPVCLAGSGGRIDCLARGSDSTLQQRTYR